MRLLSRGGLLAAAILTVLMAGILLPEPTAAQSAEVTFRVTVTNASKPQDGGDTRRDPGTRHR